MGADRTACRFGPRREHEALTFMGMAVERREQVFVSSTYVDLTEERQEVIQTLLEADCIPAGMELFPASDEDRWSLIRRVIDDCDYYIVIVGGRYGSVDPAGGLSYTEMEFDYAAERGTPILGFLHGDPGKIAASKSELDAEARTRLETFREKVAQRMVKFWTSPQDLGGAVAKSLIQARKNAPAEGWVRARDAMTPEMQAELAALRARVAELTAELEVFSKARHIPPADLAQGDDTYSLSFQLSYYTEDQLADGSVSYTARPKQHQGHAEITWDELFAELGPMLIDEASEHAIDNRLDQVAAVWVKTDNLFPDGAALYKSIQATADVIDDVKVQFFSLGLLEHSQKKHPVSDKNTYWTLSPAGRDHLMRLRAIRRPQHEATDVTAPE